MRSMSPAQRAGLAAIVIACLPALSPGDEPPAAKKPHDAPPAAAEWLVTRQGLAFAYEMGGTSAYQKRVTAFDEAGGQTQSGKDVSFIANRSGGLVPRGLARYDSHFALLTKGGSFRATGGINYLLDACKTSGAFTVEALLTSGQITLDHPGVILQLGPTSGRPNLALQQDGNKILLRLRTAVDGKAAENKTELLVWPDDKTHHLAVTYGASVLTVYLDGKQVLRSESVTGDFSRWRASELVFGDAYSGDANWPGKLEGIAFYRRALQATELQQQSAACSQRFAARTDPPRVRLIGKLKACTPTPTPEKIAPYYQALGVYEYAVESVKEGKYSEPVVRVAHWVILDKQQLPVATRPLGTTVEMTLEPYAANPQLETDFWVVDTLEISDLPLMYEVGP